MKREIEIAPAYDRRDPDPSKNYGIHGVTMRFLLFGDEGVVQFVLFTNWQLPHVTAEEEARPIRDRMDLKFRWQPMAADLGYHWPSPRYEGQESIECSRLDGRPCYYDGSSLNAEPVYERLLREGSEGVWAALEEYYQEVASR